MSAPAGAEDDIMEYVKRIRALRWLAMALRAQETAQVRSRGLRPMASCLAPPTLVAPSAGRSRDGAGCAVGCMPGPASVTAKWTACQHEWCELERADAGVGLKV